MDKAELQANRRFNLQLLAKAAGKATKLAQVLKRQDAQVNNYLNPNTSKPIGPVSHEFEGLLKIPHGSLDYRHDDAWARQVWAALESGVGEPPAPFGAEADDDDRFIPIPKYSAKGGLGRGRINEGAVEVLGHVKLLQSEIRAKGWRVEALGVIGCEGPSMETTIMDGDDALFNRDETRIMNGKIYVIEDADEGTRIKRLYRTGDGRVRVVSDNPNKSLYPDDHFTPDDAQARVIGRVVKRIGDL
jgi:phage repressor protein C with HTH and peptisase S24 domain